MCACPLCDPVPVHRGPGGQICGRRQGGRTWPELGKQRLEEGHFGLACADELGVTQRESLTHRDTQEDVDIMPAYIHTGPWTLTENLL